MSNRIRAISQICEVAKTKKIEEVSSKVFSEYWKNGNLSTSSQTIVRDSWCLESFLKWMIPEPALCCKRKLVCPAFQLWSRGDGAVGLSGPSWKENAGDIQDSSWEMMLRGVLISSWLVNKQPPIGFELIL